EGHPVEREAPTEIGLELRDLAAGCGEVTPPVVSVEPPAGAGVLDPGPQSRLIRAFEAKYPLPRLEIEQPSHRARGKAPGQGLDEREPGLDAGQGVSRGAIGDRPWQIAALKDRANPGGPGLDVRQQHEDVAR